MAKLIATLLALTWGLPLCLAQALGAPIPRPKPPGEPWVAPNLWVEVFFEEKPAPEILVVLQPLAPNRLPSGRPILRLTDGKGQAQLPLSTPPDRLLITFLDRERGLRLQVLLSFALGTWSLGPYRFHLALLPP